MNNNIDIKSLIYQVVPIFVAVALIAGATLAYQQLQKAIYSAEALVVVAPSNVTLSYDNSQHQIELEHTIHLEPGDHSLYFTKEGFDPIKKTITVGEHDQKVITAALEPSSENALGEIDSEINQAAYQGVSDLEFIETESQFENAPIESRLPFSNLLFSIEYRPAIHDQPAVVVIDAPDGYRQSALNTIHNWGYSLADLNINFTNHNNPFAL